MSLPESVVLQIIQPFLTDIKFCFYNAWDEFMTQYSPELKQNYDSIIRANILHGHIRRNIRDKFKKNKDAKVIEGPKKAFTLVIKDLVFVEFHKLDQNNLSSNPITQAKFSFLGQEPQFQFGDTQNLNAGYKLNPLETGISVVTITAPQGANSNDWFWDLDMNVGEVINFPTKQKEETSKKRVRTKKTKTEIQKDEMNG